MSWTLLGLLLLLLLLALGFLRQRRSELSALAAGLEGRSRAREGGTHKARLQYPQVDLSRCIGCGSCVQACPEDGVLELIHGQAMVVHGARCVGHGRCAQECPVGAIALTLGDLSGRRDIPALTESFESTRLPGVFLAGEVTGYALIRTAIAHGTAVADEVARRRSPGVGGAGGAAQAPETAGVLDLAIVGVGPAGLACALQAKRLGLGFVALEQSELGGTVAKYPRRKLVMTQPVVLPLHGALRRTSYTKEELMQLWTDVIARHALPIRTGEEFLGLERAGEGLLRVRTSRGEILARNVCLALGRRGTPNRLGVPGEELAKVSYSLLDAQSYQGRRILVVGGGDSAVEAALGLAEQPGNVVALSYRKTAFSRLRARNEQRLGEAQAAGTLTLLLGSELVRIEEGTVTLRVAEAAERVLANDEVFVFAGGKPPFELLEASGVSFDPEERAPAAPLAEQGTGLFAALGTALALALAVGVWAIVQRDYYGLPPEARPHAPEHAWLRPSGTLGLCTGAAALLLVLANLTYLARRTGRLRWLGGSLRRWMTAHVATGIAAFLCVLLHSSMAPGNTVGGHAFAALAILVATGAVGRYFYSFVPRAANGRELALDEIQTQLAALSGEWDRVNRSFGEQVRAEIQRLLHEGRWQGSFVARVSTLVANQRLLSDALVRLRRQALAEGLSRDQADALVSLARRAQRSAFMAAHYEDLRALLSTWRWLHRWVALGMVLLVALHVWTALKYGSFLP